MARSWSGFLPLNQDIKEQWGVLEHNEAEHFVQVFTSPASVRIEEAEDHREALPCEISIQQES